jgi:hypothetical protein
MGCDRIGGGDDINDNAVVEVMMAVWWLQWPQ